MLPYCHSIVRRVLFLSPCMCEDGRYSSLLYCSEVRRPIQSQSNGKDGENFNSNSSASSSLLSLDGTAMDIISSSSSSPHLKQMSGGGTGEGAKREWNIDGLKGEVTRQLNRAIKKLDVAQAKLTEIYDKGLAPEARIEEDKRNWQERVDKIRLLEQELNDKNEVTAAAIQLALELEITDTSPPPNENKKKPKKDIIVPGPRKPYFTFKSLDDIVIYAGRSAEDNDELSLNPEHRHEDEWWLHVAGAAGSHVVIKNRDDELETKYRETLLDAAVIAAHFSKEKNSTDITPVHYTRCRSVKKFLPKAGLVMILSYNNQLNINLQTEQDRLTRLLNTKTL